ncbi:MAG: carbamoyl-phosphate synthase domain-containing protein [Eubacteriales bacterium]|nr:carbamoyl-phosphate synthase domain-containing protein [Eubacteriales bacterium]
MKKAILTLSDGSVFEGLSVGFEADVKGEIVFTTGVVGYLESLTAPEFEGKILMQTFPLIGNYGVIPEEVTGKATVGGYVVREICDAPSNFRCKYPLEKFLKDNSIPCICGVDTRAITKLICKNPGISAEITIGGEENA